MTAPEVNFSELSNKPRDTVRKLEQSPSRSLRVRRRDHNAEDLVLTTASRAAEVNEVSSATTKLFLALMQHDDHVRMLVTDIVPTAFPWVRFLPKPDVQAFVVELVDALEGGESLNTPAPAAQVIAAWRHTAEVHADPELSAALRADGDDFGTAEPPTPTA